ncbi:NADP-dependent oxidoreductase domain-containing protein [Aspergillus crustosus]
MPSPATLIFGGASWATETAFDGSAAQKQALVLLSSAGITKIDSAVVYGNNESILGQINAAKTHAIDSKYPGGLSPEPSTKEAIIATALKGLENTKADFFDVYYLHAPDRRVPLEPQLEAINSLYQDGKIKRFGISNFLPGEVEDVIRIASEKGWILPTVYQGTYSAIARRAETELFPLLRKHNIEFYAYSPIAGGFLTKRPEDLIAEAGPQGQGRWDPTS